MSDHAIISMNYALAMIKNNLSEHIGADYAYVNPVFTLSVDELREKFTLYHEALSAIAHGNIKMKGDSMASLAYTTLEHGRLTCHDCSEKYDCDYAWDVYNTNGDCLASK